MRRKALTAGAAVTALLALGACGGGTASQTSQAPQVSLTAPVDGATVVVSNIVVAGSVDPSATSVLVNGKHARVSHGAFRSPLHLRAGRNRITIVASEPGRPRAVMHISVSYRHSSVAEAFQSQAPPPSPGSGGAPTPPRLGRYPADVEQETMATCVNAAQTLPQDWANYYCQSVLACIEHHLSYRSYLELDRSIVLSRSTPGIHVVVSCVRATVSRMVNS